MHLNTFKEYDLGTFFNMSEITRSQETQHACHPQSLPSQVSFAVFVSLPVLQLSLKEITTVLL